jgi:hypothetical protein
MSSSSSQSPVDDHETPGNYDVTSAKDATNAVLVLDTPSTSFTVSHQDANCNTDVNDTDMFLYDDLDEVQPAASKKFKTTRTKSTTPKPAVQSSKEIMPQQQQLLQNLQDENTTLKRNMGILYRTAKQEIQRKDSQIQQLLLQLQQQQEQGPDQTKKR